MATKTPKDPSFPHPALEVGVPQYPTPNVPDFYQRKGDVILQEKVSVDKGSYNPQPLDGSVTYTGKDANKFPAPLYLVAERPTQDGLYVFRYWANSRTYASQDNWNYDLKYSSNDPDYPIYTRTYIVRREDYTPISIGTKDPIYDNNTTLVEQEMAELPTDDPLRSLFVAHKVVYETIPSPKLTTSKLDPLVGLYPIYSNDQIVLSGTEAYIPQIGIVNEYEKLDVIKSKLAQRDYSSLLGRTWTEYETVTHTFPSYIIFTTSSPSGLNDIFLYVQARSFRVQATSVYTVIQDSDYIALLDGPVNFSTVTISCDFGTFSNVIHNASDVPITIVDSNGLTTTNRVKVQSATVNIASPSQPLVKNIASSSFLGQIGGLNYRDAFSDGVGYYQAAGGGIGGNTPVNIPISITNNYIKEMGGLRLLKISYVGCI
jgi:hypothetical protein